MPFRRESLEELRVGLRCQNYTQFSRETGIRRSTLECWRDGKNIPGADRLDELYRIAGQNGVNIGFYVPPESDGNVVISSEELRELRRYERNLKIVRKVLREPI